MTTREVSTPSDIQQKDIISDVLPPCYLDSGSLFFSQIYGTYIERINELFDTTKAVEDKKYVSFLSQLNMIMSKINKDTININTVREIGSYVSQSNFMENQMRYMLQYYSKTDSSLLRDFSEILSDMKLSEQVNIDEFINVINGVQKNDKKRGFIRYHSATIIYSMFITFIYEMYLAHQFLCSEGNKTTCFNDVVLFSVQRIIRDISDENTYRFLRPIQWIYLNVRISMIKSFINLNGENSEMMITVSGGKVVELKSIFGELDKVLSNVGDINHMVGKSSKVLKTFGYALILGVLGKHAYDTWNRYDVSLVVTSEGKEPEITEKESENKDEETYLERITEVANNLKQKFYSFTNRFTKYDIKSMKLSDYVILKMSETQDKINKIYRNIIDKLVKLDNNKYKDVVITDENYMQYIRGNMVSDQEIQKYESEISTLIKDRDFYFLTLDPAGTQSKLRDLRDKNNKIESQIKDINKFIEPLEQKINNEVNELNELRSDIDMIHEITKNKNILEFESKNLRAVESTVNELNNNENTKESLIKLRELDSQIRKNKSISIGFLIGAIIGSLFSAKIRSLPGVTTGSLTIGYSLSELVNIFAGKDISDEDLIKIVALKKITKDVYTKTSKEFYNDRAKINDSLNRLIELIEQKSTQNNEIKQIESFLENSKTEIGKHNKQKLTLKIEKTNYSDIDGTYLASLNGLSNYRDKLDAEITRLNSIPDKPINLNVNQSDKNPEYVKSVQKEINKLLEFSTIRNEVQETTILNILSDPNQKLPESFESELKSFNESVNRLVAEKTEKLSDLKSLKSQIEDTIKSSSETFEINRALLRHVSLNKPSQSLSSSSYETKNVISSGGKIIRSKIDVDPDLVRTEIVLDDSTYTTLISNTSLNIGDVNDLVNHKKIQENILSIINRIPISSNIAWYALFGTQASAKLPRKIYVPSTGDKTSWASFFATSNSVLQQFQSRAYLTTYITLGVKMLITLYKNNNLDLYNNFYGSINALFGGAVSLADFIARDYLSIILLVRLFVSIIIYFTSYFVSSSAVENIQYAVGYLFSLYGAYNTGSILVSAASAGFSVYSTSGLSTALTTFFGILFSSSTTSSLILSVLSFSIGLISLITVLVSFGSIARQIGNWVYDKFVDSTFKNYHSQNKKNDDYRSIVNRFKENKSTEAVNLMYKEIVGIDGASDISNINPYWFERIIDSITEKNYKKLVSLLMTVYFYPTVSDQSSIVHHQRYAYIISDVDVVLNRITFDLPIELIVTNVFDSIQSQLLDKLSYDPREKKNNPSIFTINQNGKEYPVKYSDIRKIKLRRCRFTTDASERIEPILVVSGNEIPLTYPEFYFCHCLISIIRKTVDLPTFKIMNSIIENQVKNFVNRSFKHPLMAAIAGDTNVLYELNKSNLISVRDFLGKGLKNPDVVLVPKAL